jgi:hypothetical protein
MEPEAILLRTCERPIQVFKNVQQCGNTVQLATKSNLRPTLNRPDVEIEIVEVLIATFVAVIPNLRAVVGEDTTKVRQFVLSDAKRIGNLGARAAPSGLNELVKMEK